MIKIKANIDVLNVLNMLCLSVMQIANEQLAKERDIESQAKYKSELYEVNILKDKIEIQRIKMRNSWSKKIVSFKITPTQAYILVYYSTRNKEMINNYNMVLLADITSSIYKQLTNI